MSDENFKLLEILKKYNKTIYDNIKKDAKKYEELREMMIKYFSDNKDNSYFYDDLVRLKNSQYGIKKVMQSSIRFLELLFFGINITKDLLDHSIENIAKIYDYYYDITEHNDMYYTSYKQLMIKIKIILVKKWQRLNDDEINIIQKTLWKYTKKTEPVPPQIIYVPQKSPRIIKISNISSKTQNIN